MKGIYILTCEPTGKSYIGRSFNLKKRVKEHLKGKTKACTLLHNAILKYGKDAFQIHYIRYPECSNEALNAIEEWKIKQFGTLYPNGYNLTTGGQGWIPSEITKRKRSESLKGKPKTETHRKALSKARQGFRFKMTEEHKKNMARKGSKNGSFRKDLHLHQIEICQRYLTGESAQELAKAFSAGETTIYRILDRNKIKRRSSGETQRLQNKRR